MMGPTVPSEGAGVGHSAWLGAVVDATTDGLWVLDRDGTTVWANDAMAALLRREPGSMTGLPARDVFPMDLQISQ